MKQRTMLAALLLGAFAAVSCLVYGPEDLPGNGGNGPIGGGTAGRAGGAPNTGGSGGGAGADGGRGGTAGGGVAGTPTAGAGMAGSSGHGGAPGMGGTGAEGGMDDGGAPPGGTTHGGGTAGATSGTGGTVAPPKTLIEDMEDGNRQIRVVRDEKGTTRNGYWYIYVNGASEKLEPPVDMITMTVHPIGMPGPDAITSTKAFRLLVSDVTPNDVGKGAAAAFNIVNEELPYDASGYTGISYYLRASRPITIRVQIVTAGTLQDGGICSKCSDHFYKEEMVGTSWNLHRGSWVDSSQFAQEGWGTPVEFDPSQIVGVQFFVPSHVTTPEIELWIDDVSFVEPEP